MHKHQLQLMRRLTLAELIRIGTRKSKLALAQTGWIAARLKELWPGLEVELVKITTRGDKILDVPLAKVGGKGLFVKEIEQALLENKVDIAVHSLKDVPSEVPEGLEVTVFPEREDPRDAVISADGRALSELPENSRVGTSSLRRMAQIRANWPHLNVVSLRGNLDTRLNKLDSGQFDCILLAAAGLNRLGLSGRITGFLEPDRMLPAIGQGALGIELRSDDEQTKKILAPLHHEPTSLCVRAERALLIRLEGGCQVPIGGYCTMDDSGILTLRGLVADEQGKRVIKITRKGDASHPETLGRNLGTELLDAGGREILNEVYGKN